MAQQVAEQVSDKLALSVWRGGMWLGLISNFSFPMTSVYKDRFQVITVHYMN